MEPNQLSSEYLNGVEAFLDKARNYANEEGLIRWPCVYCVSSFSHTLSMVEAHLIDRGFQQSYQIWNFHGESFHDMHWHQEKRWTSTISEAQYVSILLGKYFINKCTTSQQCSCNLTNYRVCCLLKFSEWDDWDTREAN